MTDAYSEDIRETCDKAINCLADTATQLQNAEATIDRLEHEKAVLEAALLHACSDVRAQDGRPSVELVRQYRASGERWVARCKEV